MQLRDRPQVRPESARRRLAALGASVILVVALASGCGTQVTPSPSTTTTPSAAAVVPTSTAATPSSSPAYADTLRIGVDVGLWRSWQVATEESGVPALTFGRLVYSGIYRYDAHDNAIPDLADGPCFVPGADGNVVRCHLIETTFQDGTPLTADDVAYTYQIFQRPVMNNCCTLTPNLKEVRVVDRRTVDFVLGSVDPTFLTGVLPMIPIFSRRSIDEAVAAFDAGTKGLTAKGLAKLADDINAEINRDPPVCGDARVAQVDAIYHRLGYPVYHEDIVGSSGAFDPCIALGYGASTSAPAPTTAARSATRSASRGSTGWRASWDRWGWPGLTDIQYRPNGRERMSIMDAMEQQRRPRRSFPDEYKAEVIDLCRIERQFGRGGRP